MVGGWLRTSSLALQEIGPSAAPYVLGKLSREDPRYGSLRKYQALWRKAPPPLKSILPKPRAGNFDELRACSALLELGPRVIPFLSAGLRDANPAVREVSAHALALFHERGKDIRKAIPSLIEVLHDPTSEVRARSAWALNPIAPIAR